MPILVNSGRPSEAYRDSLWDIWQKPLIVFGFAFALFLGTLQQREQED